MSPRPEIVLPPGFALRIDYDPESSPASLLITAYRDDVVGRRYPSENESYHLPKSAKGAAEHTGAGFTTQLRRNA